jgi:hypothetical protein
MFSRRGLFFFALKQAEGRWRQKGFSINSSSETLA